MHLRHTAQRVGILHLAALSVRLPDDYSPWRGHPVGAVAWLDGSDEAPSIVIKYGPATSISDWPATAD